MKERESFSSRFAFIIVSVSCAIGLGNVWLMPFRVGQFGGALFLLLVIGFIFMLSVPILLIEYSIGRGSGQSAITAFQKLTPKGKYNFLAYTSMAGNYLLLMFFTAIVGIILMYVWRAITGELIGASPDQVAAAYGAVNSSAGLMYGLTAAVMLMGLGCSAAGLKGGVERVGKYMMGAFFVVALILIVRALTLPGAMEGVRFIMIPNLDGMREHGVMFVLHMALGQALFSLSVGIGGMLIFGSYFGKERRLFGDALTVGILDVTVIVVMLFVIFPAAFAFGIPAAAGEGLLFLTMPNVLNAMPASYVWSLIFYFGLFFVAFSTVVAILEACIANCMDKFGWSRSKTVLINIAVFAILILPGTLGRNLWAPAPGTLILGQFPHWGAFIATMLTEILLPIGAFSMLLYVTRSKGAWGWDNFMANANMGKTGMKFPQGLRFYMSYILPAVVAFVFVWGNLQRWVL